MKSGRDASTTYAIKKSHEDVIIVGNSRANHHYIPSEISRISNLSAYNTGRDGMSMFYYEGIINSILSRYEPRIIVLDLWEEDFNYLENNYNRISVFSPFCKTNHYLKSILKYSGSMKAFLSKIPIYRFNGKLIPILVNSIIERYDTSSKGYIPLFKTMEYPNRELGPQYYPDVDENLFTSFKRIINMCANKKVKLIVVRSPVYFHLQKNNIYNRITATCERNGLQFIDFNNQEDFLNPRYFQDNTHLNHNGAKKLSALLAQKIYNKYK